jgi:6,7-dimethyl-8-ribityllumazine synthase
MQDADTGPQDKLLDGEGLRIGIVRARFNDALTRELEQSCLAELAALGVAAKHITRIDVPGALEVPLALKMLADSDDYDALVALGCVIRGETGHYDIVAGESARALMDLSVERRIPLANGILTVENDQQAWTRASVNELNKGGGAVDAALAVLRIKRQLVEA